MYNLVAHKIIMFGIFRDVRTGEESQKYVGGLFSLFFSLGKKKTLKVLEIKILEGFSSLQ